MRIIEIAHGTTVAHHQILETPFITENLLQQTGISTTRLIVQSLVGTHHLSHLCILHQGLEGRHIGFPHISRRDVDKIGCVASVFWSAVDSIVLGTSPQFSVFCCFRTLQTFHHLHAHHGSEIRVFTISFLTSSPTRIAEDVHIGCPHTQAVELLILTTILNHAFVVLCTKLCAGSIKHFEEQVGVERRSHRNGFWEYSYIAHVGSTMQGFAPPEELLDAQSWNSRTFIQHQFGFLL